MQRTTEPQIPNRRMQVLSKIGIQPILLLLICQFITKTEQCNRNLCFNWKLSTSTLTLKCRADELIHRVSIKDPYQNIWAACQPPTSIINCTNYRGNAKISQNPETNMTTYVIKRMMDKLLNGTWTCTHGTNLDTAYVEVFVLPKEEGHKLINTTKPQSRSTQVAAEFGCLKDTSLFTLSSIFVTCLVTIIIRKIVEKYLCSKTRCKQVIWNQRNKITYFWTVPISGLVLTPLVAFFERKTCIAMIVFPVVVSILFGIACCLSLLKNKVILEKFKAASSVSNKCPDNRKDTELNESLIKQKKTCSVEHRESSLKDESTTPLKGIEVRADVHSNGDYESSEHKDTNL